MDGYYVTKGKAVLGENGAAAVSWAGPDPPRKPPQPCSPAGCSATISSHAPSLGHWGWVARILPTDSQGKKQSCSWGFLPYFKDNHFPITEIRCCQEKGKIFSLFKQ